MTAARILGATALVATTVDVWAILFFMGILVAYERRGASIRKAAPRSAGKWGREDMVRGEGERRFNRRLTRLYDVFTSHAG